MGQLRYNIGRVDRAGDLAAGMGKFIEADEVQPGDCEVIVVEPQPQIQEALDKKRQEKIDGRGLDTVGSMDVADGWVKG